MVDFSDEHLAARLRLLMSDQGVTITEAAEAINVPYRTLQNQLSGKNRMPASTFAMLVTMLRVTPEFVATGRLKLDRPSLAKALAERLGGLLPRVDDEMNLHPPSPPDIRTDDEARRDAMAIAHFVADSYEWIHAFSRFPNFDKDTSTEG